MIHVFNIYNYEKYYIIIKTRLTMSDRIALNIGINQFRDFPQFALRGCVSDVRNFSKALVNNLGFSEQDIIELIDEQATKANIINTLKSIVNEAAQGKYSYVVFKLSTHGTNIHDESGVEVDHLDEAFVPYDISQIGDQWDREHIIVDDELAEILSKLPSNVLLEGFGDTCHSGTGLRMLQLLKTVSPPRGSSPEIKVRYVEPVRTSGGTRSAKTMPGLEEETSQMHGIRDALTDEDMRNHVWWSGCRDDQTSADANIEGAGWNGAFTYYLCEEIRKSGNMNSRAAIMDGVRKALAGTYTQTPQLLSRPEYHQVPIGSWNRTTTTSPIPSITTSQLAGTTGMLEQIQIPASAIPNIVQMLWNFYSVGQRAPGAESKKEEEKERKESKKEEEKEVH
jgi:hypothetical protein